MTSHETAVKKHLLEGASVQEYEEQLRHHLRVTRDMQHERLIHLLVTLAFGLFLVMSTGIALFRPCRQTIVLAALFLVMLAAYVAHYFYLENTIQRWYQLTDSLERLCGSVPDGESDVPCTAQTIVTKKTSEMMPPAEEPKEGRKGTGKE